MKLVLTSLVSSFFFNSYRSSVYCTALLSTRTVFSPSFLATTIARHQHTNTFSASPDTSIFDDVSITLAGPELPPVDPGSKRLFLVRHGEVINPGGDKPVFYGCLDVKLSPLGEMEAKVSV